MRFASAVHEGVEKAVAVDGDRAIPLRGVAELGVDTLEAVLDNPSLDLGAAVPLAELQLRPVIPKPRKVICVGLNYLAHVEEARRERPEHPVLFTKFATSLAGPYDALPCPPESEAIDYEGEIAVVVGRHARRVQAADALDVLAGVCVANDVSMRDFQNRTHQWLQGKAWDHSTPVGPWLVTLDEAGELGDLRLRTTVNGELVQDASSAHMMWGVAELISVISEFCTLEPGDLILTGTPSGVGFRREPPLLLAPGDVVTVELDGIGRLENTMVADDVPSAAATFAREGV
jgi:acylpyruvate hydrolase